MGKKNPERGEQGNKGKNWEKHLFDFLIKKTI